MSVTLQQNLSNHAVLHNGQESFTFNESGIVSGVDTGNRQITVTVNPYASSFTVTLQPTTISFRSASLNNGTITQVQLTSPISLTIPSGATLGSISSSEAEFYILVINAGGTAELAIVNRTGNLDLSQSNLITTVAISGSSTSASVIYSQTARTGVPYRIVGIVRSTQSTAGNWVNPPTLVHGIVGGIPAKFSSVITPPPVTEKSSYQYFGSSLSKIVSDLGGWSRKIPTNFSSATSNILQKITAVTTNNTSVPSRDVAVTFNGTFPGGYSVLGGVLLPDGRVFCVPFNGSSARIYDPASEVVITPSGSYPGSGAFFGGVLLPDGRVFCVPHNSTTARIYDPASDTLITPAGTYPGDAAFAGGVVLQDGRVFLVPHNSTTARIYNPATDTLSTPGGTYPGSNAFVGGVLLHDGRVFLVPHNGTTARIYDPATDTVSTPSGTFPSTYSVQRGVLLPDGRVFCVPYMSTTARIYDPITNILSTPSGTYPGSYAFHGGALLPDGRVFLSPFNSTTARIYDPTTDTLTTPAGTFPGNFAYVGSVLLPDSRVFCIPYNTGTAVGVAGDWCNGSNFPPSVLLGPYVNKF